GTEKGRPLIGEKGLGRLATFALGKTIRIESARRSGPGFVADVSWADLWRKESLEDYEVSIRSKKRPPGTRLQITDLTTDWGADHTSFLVTHAEFLASVPGERFSIKLNV